MACIKFENSNNIVSISIAILIFGTLFLRLPLIVLAGYTWTERQPAGAADKNWAGVASDSDGSNLIAAAQGGRLYTSSDSGVNWTERQPAGATNQDWFRAASDSDGTNLIVGESIGRLYTSSDSGVSWTERQPAGAVDKNWYTVASDSDASNLIAAVYGGRLYTSSDSGANWTERQPAGATDKDWASVASDSDGSNLIVVAYSGRIYTSADSGANWTERQMPGHGNNNFFWFSTASDADGSNLVVGALGGYLFTSSDSGVNWTQRDPPGTGDGYWGTISSNDDGSILAAGTAYFNSRLYVSFNSGANWIEQQPAGNNDREYYSVSLDSDGSNLIAGTYGNRLYTGFADIVAPTVLYFNPADGATDVAVDATFEIAFNESIATSTGNILLKKGSDDSTIETISVTSTLVTASSTTAFIINPSTTLANDTNYYFQIAATAIDDSSGNSYAGISDTTTWNFTTVAAPAVVVTSTPVGNGPIFSGPASAFPGYIAPRPQIIYPDGRIVYLDEPSGVTAVPKPVVTNTYQFTRTLSQGMSGDDVEELQKYLNTHGFTIAVFGPGSRGNETRYFGGLTQAALKRFQGANGITPAVGYFGPKTRAVVNSF